MRSTPRRRSEASTSRRKLRASPTRRGRAERSCPSHTSPHFVKTYGRSRGGISRSARATTSSEWPSPYTAAVSIQLRPLATACRMAATDSVSSWLLQPKAHPAPPMAQAPKPTRVISMPVVPSGRTGKGELTVDGAGLLPRDRVVVAAQVADDGLAQGERVEGAPGAVDDPAAGGHEQRVGQLPLPFRIAGVDHRVVIVGIGGEVVPRGRLLVLEELQHVGAQRGRIGADGDDLERPAAIHAIDGHELGELDDARPAPGGPRVDEA